MLDNIVGKECRFAMHFPSELTGDLDLHLVKEQVHNTDGTVTPTLRFIKNYKRTFYRTKRTYQNHKQKKEWLELSKLDKYECTQNQLRDLVAKVLGKSWSKDNLRRLSSDPYLYGSDINSTSLIKREYQLANPDLQTPFTVATFDIEYDVVSGVEQIILITVALGSYVYTGINANFVKGIHDIQGRVDVAMDKYLSEHVDKRNLTCVTEVFDTEIDLVRGSMAIAHKLKPDFLSIWNMNYDIPKVMEACKRADIDPKEVFSDPIVPSGLQYCNYIQGKSKKTTASGVVISIPPAAQWHTLECPASFYVIDAMCAFKKVRAGEPERQSYSLDNTLNDMLGIRKLSFTATDQHSGLRWHQVMQSDYKVEYIIYNRFDCISMQILEELTTDLSVALPMFAGCSDYERFNSQPYLLIDNLYFYMLENKKMVMASAGSELQQEADSETYGLDGWITMLPAHTIVDNGLKIITEVPELATMCRNFVYDLDVAGAYPNGGIVFNISRMTTVKELVGIKGITEYTTRMQNINLLSGQVNAIEYCTNMFGMPSMQGLLELYDKPVTQ